MTEITLEGNNIKILETNFEDKCIEVVDLDTNILYTGTDGFDVTRERETPIKIKLYHYTAKHMEKGYIEKKTIKKALEKIYEDNDYSLYMNMEENVNVIYNILKEEGLF